VNYRDKPNLRNPKVAIATFREWCQKEHVVAGHASIEDLDRFGEFLLEYGYTYDEMQNCKYVIWDNL
jgi:hypothetical protein